MAEQKFERSAPDYDVLVSTPQGQKMPKVGGAWKNTSKDGDEYITVKLGVYNKQTGKNEPASLNGTEKLLLFKHKPFVPEVGQRTL